MSDTLHEKRPRDNGPAPAPLPGGGVPPPPPLAAGEPARKRVKVNPADLFGSIQSAVGSAPTSKELSTSSGGTECYAIVVGKPESKSFKSSVADGAAFEVVNLRVILGMVDPAKNVLIDESTNEILFDIADPDEWAAAVAKKRASGSKEFIKVDKRMTHRVPLYRSQRLTVPNRSQLPGVTFPSVVRVVGLKCKGRRGKQGRLWFDLNAEDVQPVDCLGMDPAAITQYLSECGAMSDWHAEEGFATEAQLKGQSPVGETPLIVPIVRLDDQETLGSTFECDQDRGFVAAVRPEGFSSTSFFYLPKVNRKKYEAEQARDKNAKIPDPFDAGLDNWKPFGIRASWDLTVTQWDTSINPLMTMNNPLCYETTVSAYSECLWSAGLSHAAQWGVFRYHVPFIPGVLMCQENRAGTCGVQANIRRHHVIESVGPEDPRSGGMGMRQLPRVWCRGIMLDVPSYLRKYALRCSFATATVLMGAHPGDAADPSRTIRITGQCGEDQRVDKDGKVVVEKLDFKPEGFVCLNALTEPTNLRKLDERVDQYYVLTTFTPKPQRMPGDDSKMTAMISAKRQAELVPLIRDQDIILAICLQATKSYADKATLENDAKAEGASDSLKAAAEWLSLCIWGDTSYDYDTAPPYLVFATFKPMAPRIVQERAEAMQIAARAWTQGPSGAITQGRAPVRINAPAQDAVDLAPPAAAPLSPLPPPLEDATDMAEAAGPEDSSSEEEEEEEDAEMTDD